MTHTTTNNKYTNDTNRRLIVVQGPTGVGKTAAGIVLARHYRIPVVSADSRQVYREMAVGTAVPTLAEREGVPHYFIQNKSIHDPFTAGDYEREALSLLENTLFPETPDVLLVGGSGLYVDALLNGFDDLPESDAGLRAELSAAPLADLLVELERLDPEYYAIVDRANPQRVIRAVEVCRLSGKPYSALRSGSMKRRNFTTVKIGIDLPREELYERINRRVDLMIETGLLAEAETLYPYRNLPALQTVGYRELFGYFDGNLSLDQAVELIKRNTRRYAKRQLTWLRRDPQIRWFAPDETEEMIGYIDGNH
ncbi:MAG: tRNA (adenosine(37)-N6)-dimethylallyltransferase MiaA [Rikenellaceae bacterium]|nr:tRNA (adenosine(37)-N6)-dimethylallyltransferase MiaA [Rikenellaceae bacterium]